MNNFFKRLLTSAVGGTIFFGSYFLDIRLFLAILVILFVYILFFEWPALMRPFAWFKAVLLTLFFPITSFAAILTLVYFDYKECFGSAKLIGLEPFLVAWIFDSGSYVVGKLIGCHKLLPYISPNKTWEGVVGGLISVLTVYYIVLEASDYKIYFIFLLIASIFALLGDLFVSWLKRRAGLKDAGTLLPGHGGVLDRFDSVLFIPFAFFLVIAILLINLALCSC